MDSKLQLVIDWVAALRSGEYVKGYHYLHKVNPGNKHCYCVNGVLAELLYDRGMFVRMFDEGMSAYLYQPSLASYRPWSSAILTDVYDWLPEKIDLYELMYRNDGTVEYHRHSFNELADYIEKLI